MLIFSDYYWRRGMRCEFNQDSLAISQMVVHRKRCFMGIVCDGIGSFADSQCASGYVTEQMINWFFGEGAALFGKKWGRRYILNAVRRSLFRIHEQMEELYPDEKVGTTLSMLILIDNDYFWWNIGDSRIYRGGRKKYTQLSSDDTARGMLTRALGNVAWKGADAGCGRLKRRDSFLVCSDGFYRRLDAGTMATLLDAKLACEHVSNGNVLREAAGRVRGRGEKDDMAAIYVGCKRGSNSMFGLRGKENDGYWR